MSGGGTGLMSGGGLSIGSGGRGNVSGRWLFDHETPGCNNSAETRCSALYADVLVPQARVRTNKSGHEAYAGGVLENFHGDTT